MKSLSAFVFTTSTLLAQGITAHPQDSVQNSNSNLAPFGCLSPTAITDGHSQILIRALELPGPGALLTAARSSPTSRETVDGGGYAQFTNATDHVINP